MCHWQYLSCRTHFPPVPAHHRRSLPHLTSGYTRHAYHTDFICVNHPITYVVPRRYPTVFLHSRHYTADPHMRCFNGYHHNSGFNPHHSFDFKSNQHPSNSLNSNHHHNSQCPNPCFISRILNPPCHSSYLNYRNFVPHYSTNPIGSFPHHSLDLHNLVPMPQLAPLYTSWFNLLGLPKAPDYIFNYSPVPILTWVSTTFRTGLPGMHYFLLTLDYRTIGRTPSPERAPSRPQALAIETVRKTTAQVDRFSTFDLVRALITFTGVTPLPIWNLNTQYPAR